MSPDTALATSLAHAAPKRRAIWAVIEMLERVASFLALILLSPLLILVTVAIVALSRRSPLVAHLRVGQVGTPLWTLKFRTMWTALKPALPSATLIEYIVDESGMDYKSTYDPRVTSAFASFCRRTSIDELPQLINVVRGEMSLVGPRPLTDGELKKHYGFDASTILLEKPGITGLWQVRGRSRLTYEERRRMDLFLVRNRSLQLYFTILLRTMLVVWKREDGW
jgi:undecaprenyl-phosphate galactose phosphotransferase